MSLLEACAQFLEARDTILSHHPDKAAKFAVTHKGRAAFFSVDPVQGVGVAVQELITAKGADAAAPAAEAPKRRTAKSPQADTTVSPPTTPAPAAAEGKTEWTADKVRALARQVKDKIGLEKTRDLIGGPIDDVPQTEYAALVAKLNAKLAEPKPEEL